MARIDAVVATQVGDASRPAQSIRTSEAQSLEAKRREVSGAEPRQLSPATPEEIKAAAERLKTVIETATGRELNFSVNDRFKELVVKISDRKSGEVLKEIPSKEFMALRERLDDLIGLFIDEKA